MTKKLEETLDLASPEDLGYEEVIEETKDVEELIEEAEHIKQDLAVAEQIDQELSHVGSLGKHEQEMDDIALKALQAYEDLTDMSTTMTDNYVARVYEVSATMLKVALDARDSKANRKIKTLELQMKKMKLDSDLQGEDGATNVGSGDQLNRNELLELIRKDSDEK